MNKSSVLLINPWIYDFAYYDFWAKPLGLLYLAGLLRLNGYKVSLIDCLDVYYPGLDEEPGLIKGVKHKYGTGKCYRQRIPRPACLNDITRYFYRYGLSQRLFLEALNKVERPEAILVTSGMTYWYPGVFEVIKLCKQSWPDAPVILGGIYATLCHEHAKANSGADFVISGPREGKILLLLDEIIGSNISTHEQPADLEELRYPAFDLLTRIDYVCLLTSRGCPFQCSYCASYLLQPDFSRRSPESVFREILYWNKNYGIKEFAFYDDALLMNAKELIVPLLERVIAADMGINFHTPNGLHARLISPELAKLLRKADFQVIRLGLETASDHRLDNKVTFEEFTQAVSYLKEAGFKSDQIVSYLLMGLPHQSPEEVEKSIRMVKKHEVKPYLAEYSPIPGTELWKDAISCSRYDLEHEPLTHNNTVMPCLSQEFTWEDVRKLKEMAHSSQ